VLQLYYIILNIVVAVLDVKCTPMVATCLLLAVKG